MNVAELFARSARVHRDLPAVASGSEVLLTYGELVARGAILASQLKQQLGLRQRDRIALVMSNTPAYLELLLAGWWAGLIVVPINAKLHRRELAYILDHAGARVVFATPDLFAGIDDLTHQVGTLEKAIDTGGRDYERLHRGAPDLAAEVAPDEVAWLFYTSGTTGRPKGAMLTHRNLLAMSLAYLADVDRIEPGEAIVHAAPLSHGSGLYVLPHAAKAACQVIPTSGGFEPAEIFQLLRFWRGVTLFAAPTMVRRLAAHPVAESSDHPGLKTIVYGGGPMYQADLRLALQVFGNRLAQIYGQGESPMCISVLGKPAHADVGHPRHALRLASAGTAQFGVEVRVASPDDRPLPPGEIGEVLVRGDSVMRGYWRDPDATKATLRGGWLHTGDLGSLDADGFLTLHDRSKDVIICGGANVYPREVEEALLLHPGVLEVSAIAAPDPEWGERVVAFVVRSPDQPDATTLDAHCLDTIARFKRPRDYRFVERLPKNAYGKVLKTELRRRLDPDPEPSPVRG
jgi:long-chain acyl-CoA synthetase